MLPRAHPTATARASAIAVVFVANGLGAPSFIPRLPERQADLGLSDVGLGGVLAGMAVGALAASPVAGRAIGRLGSRPVVVGAALALGASLWTAGAAPSPVLLFLALAVVGAADATMDIAMNANGAAYERGVRRSVMHGLHGAWSLGALGAAGLAAAAAGLRVPLTWHLVAVGVVIVAAVAVSRSGLVVGDAGAAGVAGPVVAGPGEHGDQRTAGSDLRRRRALAVLAAATVGGALLEGAPSDWSALRLERLGTGPGVAALGMAAFMGGMLAGRLVGDRLTDRFGGRGVLRGGMVLVAAGLLAGVVVDQPAVFALGLVVAGVGCSAFFPLAFSAAGNTAGVAPGAGAATVSLAARLGFLVEPLIVGALAEAVGLRWTFALVAAVALVLAAAAARIVPPTAQLGPAPVASARA